MAIFMQRRPMTDPCACAVAAVVGRVIRWFILGVAVLLAAAPLVVAAQTAPTSARIALVCGVRCEGGGYPAFWQGLRELGWVEGRNLVVDVRGADGQPDRLPALISELLDARPNILITVAPQPARAAKNATSTLPIVFVAVADPIAAGLVTNLARPAVEAARRHGAQALFVLGDPMFHRPFNRLPELALQAKLPSVYLDRDVVVVGGGLMSYGPSWEAMFRRAAVHVDRILRGAKPGDLPIEQPTKFELLINLRTAKALGIAVPPSLRFRADQVVE